MNRVLAALVAWLALGAAAGSGARLPSVPPNVPDRVFLNGRVWTGDPARPRATALAVRGDVLTAVGSDRDIRPLAGTRTEVVDLKGRFVAPGFNDAHLHFLVIETVDLAQVWSVGEIQRRIRDYAAAHKEKSWVVGRGWFYGAFPGGLPHRRQLDEAVPDRPAFMTGYDGHTGWANTRALAAAGITRDTPDPVGGVIVKDEAGEPTGVLKETAQRLVRRHVPEPTDADRYQALRRRLAEAASYGLTSVQNASFQAAELPVYERVLAEGGLKVRVYWAVPFLKDAPAADLARFKALRAQYPGPMVKFGAAKGFIDGVVESKTAAMFEDYVGGGGAGQLNWSDEDLFRTAASYDREGFQILFHAIGDRAIDQALRAFEHAAKVNGTSGRRHRIEHVEVPRLADLPRFKALGVIASTQALFANPDKNTLEVYAVNLGPERAARAMPFKSIDDAGVTQAFGSDSPVFSMETLTGIYAAAVRKTPEGTPPGGWQPHERIPVKAALRHFTVDAAYASFEEHRKGMLAAGKLADFVVLSDDILAPPAERILRTKVLLTVMGGRDTFRAPEF
jgi:predicted amidohydrolase YtcJ